MNAREYFEGIRADVKELKAARETLEAMREAEGAKAQGYQPSTGGSASGDPMDEIARRIDFEGRLRFRIAESAKEVDEACALLYGADNRGGLAKLKGSRYADAVCMLYLQCMPAAEAAEVMRCTDKWCRELCAAAFRYIDRVGMAYVKGA